MCWCAGSTCISTKQETNVQLPARCKRPARYWIYNDRKQTPVFKRKIGSSMRLALVALLALEAAHSFVVVIRHRQHHSRTRPQQNWFCSDNNLQTATSSKRKTSPLHGAYEDYLESLKQSNSSPETEDPTAHFDAGRPVFPTTNNSNSNNNNPKAPETPWPLSNDPKQNTSSEGGEVVEGEEVELTQQIGEQLTKSAAVEVFKTVDDEEQVETPMIQVSTDGPSNDEDISDVERFATLVSQGASDWEANETMEMKSGQVNGSINYASPSAAEEENSFYVETAEAEAENQPPDERNKIRSITDILERAKESFLIDRNANPPVFENEVPLFDLDTTGMTERIMKRTAAEAQATGAGGVSTWEAFQRAEQNWARLKSFQPFVYDPFNNPNDIPPPPQFVTQDVAIGSPKCWTKLQESIGQPLDFDVVICGGTLGIFFAAALRLKGYAVCVLEAGPLRGREQEWNISMDELMELVEMGVLTLDDIDAAVKTAFPGCRSGFKQKEVTPLEGGWKTNGVGYECFTEDVLNLGISPAVLLERVSQRFFEMGGIILEETRLNGVCLSETAGAALDLGEEYEPLTTQLVIDCMGNASPISRQQRYGMKPDGICAVVGSCASGYDPETNLVGDIIYTNTQIQDKGKQGKLQYFWEAFPVGIGRNGQLPGTSDTKTTYMFTYMDADERRPNLETLMEDYWRLLPTYQPSISNPETDLDVKRVLFAFFPTYTDSPIKPQWDRILPVGDASGIQSPLSFGGFGALTRHLNRITTAIDEALEYNLLDKENLGEINAYTPNLSAAWMFQKAMSVKVGQRVDPKFVNRLLSVNFEVMDDMGQRTIKPFLQDVIRFDGLIGSLARSFIADPFFMPEIVAHVGIPRLVDWLGHVYMMGYYGFLDTTISPIIKPFVDKMKNPKERYLWRRRMDAWKYGSGNDYRLPEDN